MNLCLNKLHKKLKPNHACLNVPTKMSATPGDFSFITDSHEVTMLDSAYKAVSSVDNAWEFLKTYSPPEGEGFMFVRNAPYKLTQIEHAILDADSGHSGSSYGFVMRAMEYIAKNGWDGYVDLRTNNIKKTLQKKVARLEDENARLRQQIAELTAPKKEMTRDEKIRAALAKGCTGGYPCAGCLARKNMLVEDWHAERERPKIVMEGEVVTPFCSSCSGNHWTLACPTHGHGVDSYKAPTESLTSLVATATAVDNFIATAPTDSLTAFANAIQKDPGMRAQIPDIDEQVGGMLRYAKAVEDAKNDPSSWKKSNGFPYPCPCHKAQGKEGWCGVAGFGVPACEH